LCRRAFPVTRQPTTEPPRQFRAEARRFSTYRAAAATAAASSSGRFGNSAAAAQVTVAKPARHVQAKTGLSFGAWHQRLRLTEALARLRAGIPVTTVAQDLGYDSPSAFSAVFRRALGRAPSRYFARTPGSFA
jgi:AraC-like DNA-binding protein